MEIPDIADALNHTEADVRRALAYWERTGVLAPEKEESVEEQETAVTREMADRRQVTFPRIPEKTVEWGSAPGRGNERKKSGAEVRKTKGHPNDVWSKEKTWISRMQETATTV